MRAGLASILASLGVAGLILTTTPAHAQSSSYEQTVRYPASTAVSPRLSDLPQGATGGDSTPPRQRVHPPIPHGTGNSKSNQADNALQNWAARESAARQSAAFPGITANGSLPPDPNIAVGPNHIVQVVNTRIAVFNKNGTVYAGYPKSLSSVWTGLTGVGAGCATNNAGDPTVHYDRLADRWVVTQLGSLSAPYSQCVAVSTSPDPTGTYVLYAYDYGTYLNDYSKFGVWPTTTNSAYLETVNVFANGSTFVGADLCAMDRAAMLAGQAATQICYRISNDGGFLPSDLDGATPPPDGTPGYFLTFETLSSLRLYQMAPNFASPSSSTLTLVSPDIVVSAFDMACTTSTGTNAGGTCIPQPSSAFGQQLDSLGDRLMYRLAYRNYGDRESLVVNHSVKTTGSASGATVGVRWYELRKTPVAANGAVSLYQQGTYGPTDGVFRWMGSAAMDKNGNLAIGYSASSSSLLPSVRVATRTATDTRGMITGESTLQAGGGSQLAYSRWGDYSSMRVDPVDDCTFWYTNEYYTSTGAGTWTTFIGSMAMPGCGTTTLQTLTTSVTGSGTVTSNPSGISCPSACTANYANNTVVALTATPASGYSFSSWGGACSGNGACSVTMNAGQNVTATFTANPQGTLTVSKVGNGTVTSNPAGINCGATCSTTYPGGTLVTLTATPGSGSAFNGWSGAGCSGTGTCTVTITASQTVSVTANFVPVYTLTVSRSGSGTVTSSPTGINCGATCSASFKAGTIVTLTEKPKNGRTFAGWGGACSTALKNTQCVLTISGPTVVSAGFQ